MYLFDMAPRTFGEIWGENHVLQLFPEFVKATKEKLMFQYPGFDGEFDLLLDGIRVEVKACLANSTGILPAVPIFIRKRMSMPSNIITSS